MMRPVAPFEMPLVPGLSFSSDQWHRRAVTPGGFKKAQLLAQEWTLSSPSNTPRALTARGSPRSAKLVGASARHDEHVLCRPTTVQPSRPSFRKMLKQHEHNGPGISEASDAYSMKRVERPGVLRFAAYVDEKVDRHSSSRQLAEQRSQIRKFFVMYHLQDQTVEVLEERVANSGIPGGKFFSRAPPSAGGKVWQPRPPERVACRLGPEALVVGGCLDFLGLTFHLVDADKFTRDYYASVLHIEQPPFAGFPQTCPQEYRAEHATRMGVPSNNASYGKFGGIEVHRTSPEASTRHAQMAKERQFFRNDGEVLAFVASWRDPAPGGEDHEFTLNFHISDKRVELITPPQQGFDRFTHLLANRRLPLNWEQARHAPELLRYAEPEDLVIGKIIDVYNRSIQLLDCTEFTRHWYSHRLGIEQPPGLPTKIHLANEVDDLVNGAAGASPRSQSPRPRQLKKAPTPAERIAADAAALAEAERLAKTNPFCTNELVKKSLPTKQRDLDRKTRLADKVVRCRLRQIVSDFTRNACPAIAHALDKLPRTFVLTYYLASDELAIFEEHVNNSGVLGGAYLKRGKYTIFADQDATSKRPIKPADLRLGTILKFSANNCLKVVEFDAASLKTMADLPQDFPFANATDILRKLSDARPDHAHLQANLADALAQAGLDEHDRLVLTSAFDIDEICQKLLQHRDGSLPSVDNAE